MKLGRILLAFTTAALLLPANPLDAKATPHVFGKTIGDWGLEWWRWGLSFATADCPILQDGAVDCSAGQSGKVWFLAGNFGGASSRSCTVPKGKAIFFPIFNAVFWTPEDCADEAGCRTGVAGFTDPLSSWSCTIDGAPCIIYVPMTRDQSKAGKLALEEGTIAVTDFGYDAGVREVAIADGYWVMLDPLAKGTHTLHFTAEAVSVGFSLDVTYSLTVE